MSTFLHYLCYLWGVEMNINQEKLKVMKKILLSIAVLVFSASSALAGNNILGFLNVGARIGIVSSSENIPTDKEGIKNEIMAEGTGWTGNLFARINIPKLPIYIQPELQYTNTTINIPTIESILGKDEQTTETHKYIDMPLLLGAEFGIGDLVSLRVNAGPVFAIASEKGFKDLTEDDFVNAWEGLKTDPHMTWTAGLGVKVLDIIAEIRYNGNFNGGKIDTSNIEDSINTQRTSWNLSLGIMF